MCDDITSGVYCSNIMAHGVYIRLTKTCFIGDHQYIYIYMYKAKIVLNYFQLRSSH